jgi:hypothetical protein
VSGVRHDELKTFLLGFGKCEMVGFADLGPALPAAPLVQDDELMRGGYCAAQLLWDWDWVAQGWPKRRPRAKRGSRKR